MAIKIMLVDDHKLIRDAISNYLEDDPNFEVVAEAKNGKVAFEKVKKMNGEIDVILTDINMHEMDGIDSTKLILKEYPNIKVIGLSMLVENHYIKKLIQNGAKGYLLKSCDESEIKDAIHTVMNGELYYSKEVMNIVMNNVTGVNPKPKSRFEVDDNLSKRELEVLKLILKEYSNQEIADELYISVRTVDAHKRNLLDKTGAKNLAGLALYAINNQLFEDL